DPASDRRRGPEFRVEHSASLRLNCAWLRCLPGRSVQVDLIFEVMRWFGALYGGAPRQVACPAEAWEPIILSLCISMTSQLHDMTSRCWSAAPMLHQRITCGHHPALLDGRDRLHSL